jgi:uncharacterized repeat protein (TIGR03803 family)
MRRSVGHGISSPRRRRHGVAYCDWVDENKDWANKPAGSPAMPVRRVDDTLEKIGRARVDGNLYGTTGSGGASNEGTVFKFSPAGTLTIVSFAGPPAAAGPADGLLLATDGSFYGTTVEGGLIPGAQCSNSTRTVR